MATSSEQLDVLVRASYPILYVVSHEEDRVEAAITSIVEGRNRMSGGATDLWVWSSTKGASCLAKSLDKDLGPVEVLDFIETYPSSGVFVLRDYGYFLHEGPAYTVQRRLKDLASHLARVGHGSVIIIVDSSVDIPTRVEKVITVVDFDLPTREELADRLRPLVRSFPTMEHLAANEMDALLKSGVECATGLTLTEAENVFAKSVSMTRTITPNVIVQDKKSIIRKSGVLEFYDVDTEMGDVGGLENLKDWLGGRGRAFTEEARAYGLPTPKGVLLVGVPGTGKSLIAKCIGNQWGMPVLRMDIGSLFGSLVGQSESNMRKALKTAEAMAPCVLWIDELEKGMGSGGGTQDGGTTSRVFGNFLSWMQEKSSPVFVVATANNVDALPPEMLRKGRFDEIFFSDLPTLAERIDILDIHIRRAKRVPDSYNRQLIAAAADNFSGAEIEQVVVDSLYRAFQQGREPTTEDMCASISATTPLFDTMQEKIVALREWARTRAVPANKRPVEVFGNSFPVGGRPVVTAD